MAKDYYSTMMIEEVPTLVVDQEVPISEEKRDFAFEKFFAGELLHRLQFVKKESMQVKSLTRVLSVITGLISLKDDRNNMIYASVTEIAKELGLSRKTAHRYLKTFDELGMITNVGNSRWQLDPAVFAHMRTGQRKNILIRYKAVRQEKENVKQRKLFEEQEIEFLEAVNG